MSLQVGHRMSVDIDLFTDNDYGSIDFNAIREFLNQKYPFCISRNLESIWNELYSGELNFRLCKNRYLLHRRFY